MNARELPSQWSRMLPAMNEKKSESAALPGPEVSEAGLINGLPGSRRLTMDLRALIDALAGMGTLRVITGNQTVALEQTGRYSDISLSEKVGLMLNPGGLDLRFFRRHWHSAFAVEYRGAAGEIARAVRFYDEYGEPVHLAQPVDTGIEAAWRSMLERFAPPVAERLTVTRHAGANECNSTGPDRNGFVRDWLALRDVHQFHGLLQKYGLSRRQAFGIAPAGYADPLAPGATAMLLREAARDALPIMAFVGNRGAVQIYTGTLHHVDVADSWLTASAAGTDLRMCLDRVAETWRVRRPTRDGIVTSVELLAADGDTVLTFFGQRTEGHPERPGWKALADALPLKESGHVV
jgi:putative hemin transport protein